MFISLLIVNGHSGNSLPRCLACLAAQTYVNFEVLIAGDWPLSALPDSRFRMIDAANSNEAGAAAKGVLLIFMEAADYAEPEWLMALVNTAQRYQGIALFGSILLADGNPEQFYSCGYAYNFAGFVWRSGAEWPLEALPDDGVIFAACGPLAIRADSFNAIGGFDESFENRDENLDLAFRARLMGQKTMLASEAVLRHDEVQPNLEEEKTIAFRHMRNTIRVFVKNMPPILLWTLLPFHIVGLALVLFVPPRLAFVRWDGIVAACKEMPDMLRWRRTVQAERTISSLAIAPALNWSLRKMFWRMLDVREV
jgi:hypothetical protein